MPTDARTNDTPETQPIAWQPHLLPAPGLNEVRFGRGFLRADLAQWFEGFSSHWLPLFHAFGVAVEFDYVKTSLQFPETLTHVAPIELDGELSVFACDEKSLLTVTAAIAPATDVLSAEVVMEYLERRFLSTLALSWSGEGPVHAYFLPPEHADAVEVIGAIEFGVRIGGKLCTFWLGLGPHVLERIDSMWRAQLLTFEKKRSRGSLSAEEIVSVSFELAELAVAPAKLIDYMRVGTVIPLEAQVDSPILIRVNGETRALATLQQFSGKFAARIESLDPPEDAHTPLATTRLQICLARVEIDNLTLTEYLQVGAVIPTRTPVTPTAFLVISGEEVSSAVIGQINDRYALNILPK